MERGREMCFLFDVIRLCGMQTPAELNIQDDDIIEARRVVRKRRERQRVLSGEQTGKDGDRHHHEA